MNVQELITELEQIENKSLPVYFFPETDDGEITAICFVDTGISDRVDLQSS